MNNSHSHESLHVAKKPRRRLSHKLGFSRKATNLAAGALAVLLLGGFVLYQNIPNLSMRLASNRAGFSASLPSYKPSGFSLRGPIEYSPGKVTVAFRSNSDDRSYKLSQQVSNWNSQSLVDNFMREGNRQYQTLEENGKTIYIYGGNNATWVSGGVWYQVEANTSLSSDQLVKIAAST